MAYDQLSTGLLERVKAGIRMVIESVNIDLVGHNFEEDEKREFLSARWLARAIAHEGKSIQTTELEMISTQVPLTSASRNATTSTPVIENTMFARGIIAILHLTAFTTAANLQLYLERENKDGSFSTIAFTPGQLTAVGKHVMIRDVLIRDNAGGFDNVTHGILPHRFRFRVQHNNGNAHTYTLSYQLIR